MEKMRSWSSSDRVAGRMGVVVVAHKVELLNECLPMPSLCANITKSDPDRVSSRRENYLGARVRTYRAPAALSSVRSVLRLGDTQACGFQPLFLGWGDDHTTSSIETSTPSNCDQDSEQIEEATRMRGAVEVGTGGLVDVVDRGCRGSGSGVVCVFGWSRPVGIFGEVVSVFGGMMYSTLDKDKVNDE